MTISITLGLRSVTNTLMTTNDYVVSLHTKWITVRLNTSCAAVVYPGVGEVIKGWDRGVAGMRVGDKRKLTVPPQMGYGSDGVRGTIPPNATLLFNVELVDVK